MLREERLEIWYCILMLLPATVSLAAWAYVGTDSLLRTWGGGVAIEFSTALAILVVAGSQIYCSRYKLDSRACYVVAAANASVMTLMTALVLMSPGWAPDVAEHLFGASDKQSEALFISLGVPPVVTVTVLQLRMSLILVASFYRVMFEAFWPLSVLTALVGVLGVGYHVLGEYGEWMDAAQLISSVSLPTAISFVLMARADVVLYMQYFSDEGDWVDV